MSITAEDYYRKGHTYLETDRGREDIFNLYKNLIDQGIKENNLSKSISAIQSLKSYIKGDNLIFFNYDIPNIWTLKKKKEEIKKHALNFMKENIDLIKKVYIKTDDVNHKFDIITLFVKFMPEIKDLRLKHYTDLYVLMFHTIMFLDNFEGKKEEDKFDLGDVILRAFGKYDCLKIGEKFIRQIKLKEILNEYAAKYTPYEEYIKRLNEGIKKMQIADFFMEEDFCPLIFTDKTFYVSNDLNNGFIMKKFLENRDKINSYINSRIYDLFEEKNNEIDILNNAIKTIIEEKAQKKS